MADMKQKATRSDRKKQMTRLVCLVIAAVMILSTVVAAVLSQVW